MLIGERYFSKIYNCRVCIKVLKYNLLNIMKGGVMGNFIEDAEKRIDEERAWAQEKKQQEERAKAEADAKNAQKKDDNSLIL